MKVSKKKILIFLVSIGLGIFLSIMLKSNLESYAPVTISHLKNTEKEISDSIKELNHLDKIIEDKEKELQILNELVFADEDITDKLDMDLILNKSISGYIALEGPGITIKMYDNPEEEIVGVDVNDDVIHDVDVLNILNDLRVAGAEAISINGERVVTSSELKCRGPVIGINGISIGTPFIISAIGDSKMLMASVNAPGTYGDALKNIFAIGFEAEEKDDLYIPAYSGSFDFKYAEPVREDGK